MSTDLPPDSPDALVSRLERGAHQLDLASQQHVPRRTTSNLDPSPRRSVGGRRSRERGPLLAVLAVAASMFLVGAIVSDVRNNAVRREVVATPGPSIRQANFPFIGSLTISVPTESADSGQTELVTFRNGRATTSDQRTLRITSAVDVDLDRNGTSELALVIDRSAGPGSPQPADSPLADSAVVVVGPETPDPAVATTGSFGTHIEMLAVSANQLRAVSFEPGTNVATITRLVERDGVLRAAQDTSVLTRTDLPLIRTGDREIRFKAGTSSGLIRAGRDPRTGWFRARAGQTLRIDASSVASGSGRDVVVRTRNANGNQTPLGSVTLPATLTVELPVDGLYELLVGSGEATIFELTIEGP